MTPTELRLRPRSAIPGRERWVVDGLRSRPRLAAELEGRLRRIDAVLEVRVNPVIGSVLVRFDAYAFRGEVQTRIRVELSALLTSEAPGSPGVPSGERPRRPGGPFRRLARAGEANPGLLAAAVLMSAVGAVLNVLPFLGHAISAVVAKNRGSRFLSDLGVRSLGAQFALVGAATLGAEAIFFLWDRVRRRSWASLAARVEQNLQIKTADQLIHLDLAYLERQKIGNLLKILQVDTRQIHDYLDTGLHDVVLKVTQIVGCCLVLAAVSPLLAALVFLPFPFIYLSSRYFRQRVEETTAEAGELEGHFSHLLENVLSGVVTIKSFVAEEHEVERLRSASDRSIDKRLEAFDFVRAYTSIMRAFPTISFTAAISVAGLLHARGSLALVVYEMLQFLIPQISYLVTNLDVNYDTHRKTVSAAERILRLLALEPALKSGPTPLTRETTRGDLALRDVSFGYSPDNVVLRDLDVRFRPGETTALVGSSGSGKTTMIKLLMRYYDADDGVVEIDDQDVRSLVTKDLRQVIGYVSQDIYLFHGTVFDNIAYGRPDATPAEVVAAAERAAAHGFIEALPRGYETIVGERGQKLSRGERQRVSIARAFLKDPAVLILDEATSALDGKTESAILERMEAFRRERTVIMVAHRLSTVKDADSIYVLVDGRVREAGTHADLIELDQFYAALWKIQVAGGR